MIVHPCLFAEGNYGNAPYKCKLTGSACTAQFYCQDEKYWRPNYKIKCLEFKDKTKEQPSGKKDEQKQNEQ